MQKTWQYDTKSIYKKRPAYLSIVKRLGRFYDDAKL